MFIYIYDPKTKEYLKCEEAARDPLESELAGKFVPLLAANSTIVAPLKEKEGYVSVWNGSVWEYEEDHRKEKYWLLEDKFGSPGREMKEIGPLPEGASLTAPEKTLEEMRADKHQEIKSDYLKDLYAPFWFNQTMDLPDGTSVEKYVGYDTDKDSLVDFGNSQRRAQLLGSTLYNIYVDPENLKKKEFTYHTPEMFERVFLAAGNYQQNVVYIKYYNLCGKIDEAASKEDLEKIKW